MKRRLLASVASTALLVYLPPLRAQTPSLDEVYRMVLELKASQAALSGQNKEFRNEALKYKRAYQVALQELVVAQRKLEQATRQRANTDLARAPPSNRDGSGLNDHRFAEASKHLVRPTIWASTMLRGSPFLPASAMPTDLLPAVSGPNAKFETAGGSTSSGAAGYESFSLTVPLGHDFGLQGDFLNGNRPNGSFLGGA